MFKEVISRRLFCLFAAVALLGGLLGAGGDSRKQVSADFKPRLRRPVALALAEDGRWLFVANERAGSISLIDTATTQAVLELAIGKRLVDLAVTPDGRHLLTVDEEANELVLLSRRGQSLKVLQRLSVSAAPVSVCVTGDGSRCYVASLWSRQLSVVELKPEARVQRALALPFAPRCQLLVNRDSKLIVAV